LLVDALSRLATMSGMPSSAPVVLSYAVYAVLLVAAVLFLPGGIASVLASLLGKLERHPRVSSRARMMVRPGE
jgi:branched-chain amino acid transport system permease protein